MTIEELSFGLFVAAVLIYSAATFAYFATTGEGRTAERQRWGTPVASGLVGLGVLVHVTHIVVRSIAADRLPLGNMFEFSSIIALTTVVGGLWFIQKRLGRPELMGFVLLGSLVTLFLSMPLYSDPAPLQPILETGWRYVHVSLIAVAFGLLSLGAVFNALQLLRDTAERRVAVSSGSSFGSSSVGAAQAPTTEVEGSDEHDATLDAVLSRIEGDDSSITPDDVDHDAAYRAALRDVLAQKWLGITFPWRIALGSGLVGLAFSSMFLTYGEDAVLAENVRTSVTMAFALFALTGIAWSAVGRLPSATTLDSITYRTIAVAFPLWTLAVITGAMWAEVSWGRFWGWDPKETSAFLTWVSYAGYLHARATRGMNGRRAAWLGLASYGVLLFTYYAVNLLITGLHSYGGLPT